MSENFYRVAAITQKKITKIIPVNTAGTGVSMPQNIEKYYGSFTIQHPFNIAEARAWIIKSVPIVIETFNNDCKIQEFLEERPFNTKNIHISIYLKSFSFSPAPAGYIDSVSFAFGKIYYEKFNPETSCLVNIYEETYEEALEKFHNENNSSF